VCVSSSGVGGDSREETPQERVLGADSEESDPDDIRRRRVAELPRLCALRRWAAPGAFRRLFSR
jgi:hypothetical protein